jgi:hypothetical protein
LSVRIRAEFSFLSVRHSFNHAAVLAGRGEKMESKRIASIGSVLAGLTLLCAQAAPVDAVSLIVDGGDQYTLHSGESVIFGDEFIGYVVPTPTPNAFNHFGGSNTTDSLTLGLLPGTIGVYEMWAGTLQATTEFIGSSGSGTFLHHGGINTTCDLTLNDGIYNLAGGTVNVSDEVLNNDGHGRLYVDGGTLNAWKMSIDEFQIGRLSNGSFELHGPQAELRAIDMYIGNQAAGSFVNCEAETTISNDLHLGYSAAGSGALRIIDSGRVTVGGSLTVDLNGGVDSSVNMGSGGMLVLAGNAGGSLGAFLNLVDGSDAIRYWDQAAWEWADISGAGPGAYTLTEDGEGHTTLTVTAPPPSRLGDTNGDFVVEDQDYANLVAQFGGAPGQQSADFNRDGLVNLEDFVIMRSNFHAGPGPAPEAGVVATIPEPASLVLLAGGLPLLSRIKRRGRGV